MVSATDEKYEEKWPFTSCNVYNNDSITMWPLNSILEILKQAKEERKVKNKWRLILLLLLLRFKKWIEVKEECYNWELKDSEKIKCNKITN